VKTCSKCLIQKPLSEFHKGTSQCKSCKSLYWKNWRKRNPDKAKLRDAKANAARLGVTLEYRQQLFTEQNGRCAICGDEGLMFGEGTQRDTLPLDHDHITGQIRGLLCIKCNRGLGLFKDNPDVLRKAADYLEGRVKNVG